MLTNKKRVLTLIIALSMIAALVPSGFTFAEDADFTLVSVMRQDEPITYYGTSTSQVSTFDPRLAEDSVSITQIENLFLGLADYDPLVPGNVNPELATEWTVDETGTVWTFTVRNDVPWVKYDSTTGEAEMMRMVTAQDIEYGIKRSCNPVDTGYYSTINSQIIAGCDVVFNTPAEEVTAETFDQVQVFALDDTTLEVNLQFSAGYFLGQLPMWQNRPVPQEIIDEFGDDWTLPENIWTNGPFMIEEYVRGVRRVYVRNPLLPADLQGPGNVERIVTSVVEDIGTSFALYQDNQIDVAGVPAAELQAVLDDPAYEGEVFQVSDLAVFYFAFAHDKAPFDNVNVRRAFNASVDRNAFIQEVQQGRGIPMIHFTPPGMFGAPPINEVGVGYNPDFAREQMAEGGYPDCEGFPTVDIVTYSSAGSWAEFLSAAVERELGCDPNLLTIEQLEFSVLLEVVDAENETEDRPNMWTLGWGPDYADANNWVGDVLACDSGGDLLRACAEVDDLIAQARTENDPETRIELYYRIEELFFGEEGDTPIIPLYLRSGYTLQKSWVDYPLETDGLFGGAHWNWISIDQAAQLEARG